MGKKRSAARRATATAAAAASAANPSPAVPLDAPTAPVDTTTACDAEESLAKAPPQPRVSHEADATRAPRAVSPAQCTIDVSFDLEPAITDVRATTPVAIATPPTHERRASDSCPESHEPPPALTTPTSTSNDVPAVSLQQPRVSQHADMLTAPQTSFSALSAPAAAAAADLATAIDTAGLPTVFLACPTHVFCRAEDFSRELESLAPRTSPATRVEEIDEDLLENIIEDAQNAMRIEVRHEVRVKALKEGQKRGWREGFEEGERLARRDSRAEARQRELAWKDGYEHGRWEGYREGLEAARNEVSTPSCVDTGVQVDDPISPHPCSLDTRRSPSIDIPAPARVDTGIQFDTPPLPSPSRCSSPPSIPIDTIPNRSRIDANVQTDNPTSTRSPPTSARTTTPRVDAGVQSDAPTRALAPTPRIDIGVQADALTPPPSIPIDTTSRVSIDIQTHDPTPTRATSHIDTGVQAEDPPPPFLSDDSHSPHPRVQASTQTDTPCSSAPARARTVQEIERDLLTNILAKAIAKGEAAGLKKGKQVGFLDGMEAGWKSGTKEGHEDGYREGKQSGINEGREQYRLEVSRIPHAVAVVQTDYGPLPTRVDSASQTAAVAVVRRRTSTCHSQFPTTAHCNMNSSPATVTSTLNLTDLQQCTFISNATGNVNMPHDSLTTPSHIPLMSHNGTATFSWADDASSLPIRDSVLVSSCTPRDFSILRSSSHRPFDSLKRRARRSHPRSVHPTCSYHRPPIPSSEPIVTHRHPAGLRADRPSVVVSSSPSIPHSVKLEAPPLDWQGDPRLHELGRVLRGLGWVHRSGS